MTGGAGFLARKENLNKELSGEELADLAEKYRAETSELMSEFMVALTKLQQSGRMTRELQEALSKVN